MKFYFIMSIALLCLNWCTKPINMTIDAYTSPGAAQKRNYFLLLGENDLAHSDLEAKEFQFMTEHVLADIGFTSVDKEDADIGIFLNYGISDPIISQYTYSSPLYGQTGIASSYTTGNINGFSNCATYTQRTSYTPQFGVVGYETKLGTLITYLRHLSLTGYDMEKFRSHGELQELWHLHVSSAGETGDLRRIFPVLLGASKAYIGTSTGRKINVSMYETDDEVLKIKGIGE